MHVVEIVNKPDTGISCINVISSDRYERKFDNKYSSTSSRFRKYNLQSDISGGRVMIRQARKY